MSISTPATRCMNEIIHRTRELYHWVATDALAKRLRDMAGQAFAEGNDKRARWLRGWADEEKEEARKLRVAYDAGKTNEPRWDDLAKLIIARGGFGEESEWPEEGEEALR